MTLCALAEPTRYQSKCQTSSAASISHSKEECPCVASGNSGWVPTMVHSPTRISNCFIELVGCGGSFACSFMFITPMYSRVLNSAKHALCFLLIAARVSVKQHHFDPASQVL